MNRLSRQLSKGIAGKATRTVALSLTAWFATVPPIALGSFTDVEITEVALFDTGPPASVTVMSNVVVSVAPGATRFSVGSNTSARIAVCAAAAVPLNW